MPPRVSLTMIVKNEEANLPACLEAVADLVHEIIIVDTGSTDHTRQIAARYGAQVFTFPWCDSFAAARNAGLDHATGDWIFWLDADDRIDEENRRKLRALFAELNYDNVAYRMPCVTHSSAFPQLTEKVWHIRLFRNLPGVRWRYRVHEQILPAILLQGGTTCPADVTIQHTGYQDPVARQHKKERNLHLLRLNYAESPNSSFVQFYLGWTHLLLDQPAEALPFLQRSLALNPPDEGMVRKLYVLLGRVHHALGQREEALAVCREGRTRYADHGELLFQEGCLHFERRDLAAAEACLLQALQQRPNELNVCDDNPALRGFQTRYNLAVIYRDQGRLADAEREFGAVLAERPDYADAYTGLGELYLVQGRWQALEQMLPRMRQILPTDVEATGLEVRMHLARKDFGRARQLAEQALARAPEALGPRLALASVLVQEGRDLAAAEQALVPALEREPGNLQVRETGNSLAMTYRRQGRGSEAERLWRRILAGHPDYGQAWLGLGGLYREQARWDDLWRVLEEMARYPQLAVDATLLQARTHLERREFAAAQSLLTAAAARWPEVLTLHVALADVLLVEGRDPAAAEKALRDVLARAPNHAPTQSKLRTLLSQQARSSGPGWPKTN
jgi:tetratricopeptide (TPR) repeat protein